MSPYELAYDYVLRTNRCIFLTGKAGTGKTTLLRRLQAECPKQTVVVAPTGVAAINAEGVTIHSLFQLPPQLFIPTPAARRQLFAEIQLRQAKLRLLRNMELLVIDEVSMVRSDLLDTMDAVLRHVRHRQSLPFGGVQVLFIGDLYQLSPVAREQEWLLLRDYYDGPYFFQARVFREIQPVYIELDHVYRQQDTQFIDLLNEVRNNRLTPQSLNLLNSRYRPDWQPREGELFHITLSTHNHKVDELNAVEFDKLAAPAEEYHAVIQGTFPDSMYPLDPVLRLKVGARVMFTRNDSSPEKQYYNGKLGVVSECDADHILVLSDEGEEIDVHTETWENIRYVSVPNSDEVKSEVSGTFTHIPLRLAWAVTIHKAQGLTFDHVVIDAADAFAAGQVYVALSRCRSLEGIILLTRIPENALSNAREVLLFTAAQPTLQAVADGLKGSQQDYLLLLLSDLYDFRDLLLALEMVQRGVEGTTSFNLEETRAYLTRLYQALQAEQQVAETFHKQIRTLIARGDWERLQQRMQAAHGYFAPRLQQLCDIIKASPAYTDNKQDGKDYEERMTELHTDLARKRWLMQQITEADGKSPFKGDLEAPGYWIAALFQARARFLPPKIKLTTRVEQELPKAESKHPRLLRQLQALRRRVAEDQGVTDQIYRVAATKTLVEIADRLPRTKKEMLAVKGMGAKKYALYGEQALEIVKKYLKQNSD
ncbi:MAG: AAA family ATPase [Paludibacteraceae bacterium]